MTIDYAGAGEPPGAKYFDSILQELLLEEEAKEQAAHSPVIAPYYGDTFTDFGGNNVAHVGNVSVDKIRADFPILSEKVNGKPLIWFDNGATTQKPRQVINRISYYYEHENSNVHRGAHELAARSTDAYEAARGKVADFIGAGSPENIVFVRGTTEGINLVAQSYVKPLLNQNSEIILTMLEHHANIVPWQIIAAETGAKIKVAPVDSTGQIILSEYEKLFNHNTKFASVTQVSNALGTITPVHEMVQIAHRHGVRILVDGAQSISHIPVNVTALDADFFVFSGHKIYAPTGIGALYGKKELLEIAQPYQGGGNMIKDVTFERTVYNPAPLKFEAGTGSIADAVGLGAALDYVSEIGLPNILKYEHDLLAYATSELGKISGVKLIGTAAEKTSVLSFVLDGFTTEQVGKYLNNYGIAVRTGHHCAQPILRHFGVESSVRPTFAFYNTFGEIDVMVRAIYELVGS
ncbi:MAG: cysteine desulfurase [Oscillospiraceae bacterium]|nr:cysteine desulfurase [Oscillospiraceae bacterium]